jgi:hypothetical protein
MSRRMLMIGLLVVVALFPMLNRRVQAHHSQAIYSSNEVTLKGTVAEYDWGNPHVTVAFDVKDDRGNVVRWTGELASVSSMLAVGLTKNSLKPGDDVIVIGKAAKSGSPNCVVNQIQRPDGTWVLRSREQVREH